jgi:hypothetical protein
MSGEQKTRYAITDEHQANADRSNAIPTLEMHAKPGKDAGVEHRVDEDISVGALPSR